MDQCEVSSPPQVDQPAISLSASDAVIAGTTGSFPYQSSVIDLVSAAPNLISSRLVDYGAGAPPVASSLNADLGRLVVDVGHDAAAIRTTRLDDGNSEERQGFVATADATPTIVAECTVRLAPHSSAVIDVEVHAEATDESASAVWKISDVWKKSRLGDSPVHSYTVSSTSAGTAGGSPPSGWSVDITSVATNEISVQVTGVASTGIRWVCRATSSQVINEPSTWTPLELAPSAWFRADVVSGTGWTDQSGNGNDALRPLGVPGPTSVTLAGQPALFFTGGAYLENTTTNLISGGGSCTVLAIAKAVDDTGGAVFSCRDDVTNYFGAEILTEPVGAGFRSRIAMGGGTEISLLPSVHEDAQNPFVAEWSIYDVSPFGRNARFEMNGRPFPVSGYVADERGGARFTVGSSPAGNLWNGVIAELVVLDRAITASERERWRAYAAGRYGISRGPQPWTPSALGTALRGWFRADNFGRDLSGSGNNMTVTGTSSGGGLNGHPTVVFNGTSDYANVSTLSLGGGTGAISIVLVCKLISPCAPGAFGCFLGLTIDSLHFHQLVQGSTGDNPRYDSTTSPGVVVGTGFHRYLTTDDGTTAFMYFDNVATDSAGVPSIGYVGGTYSVSVGDRQMGALFSNIEVAEFIVLRGVPNIDDRANIDAYLRARYGL